MPSIFWKRISERSNPACPELDIGLVGERFGVAEARPDPVLKQFAHDICGGDAGLGQQGQCDPCVSLVVEGWSCLL